MVKQGSLNVPVVGVASTSWNVDQLRDRVIDSVSKSGVDDRDALSHLLALLQYMAGDYNNADTFKRLKQTLEHARRPVHYLAIPPSLF